MRTTHDPQPELGEVGIESIELDLRSRDDIPALLIGLQHLYSDKDFRERLFALMEEHMLPGVDRTVGRPGMEMWRILVMGVVKQGLGCDFDRLQELVNQHKTLRRFLGHADIWDEHRYKYQTLVDNVSLLNPGLLVEVNKLIVESGHAVARKKPGAPLRGRVDSFVAETDVHYPTDVSLLWDAMRCLIRATGRAATEHDVRGWRQWKHLVYSRRPGDWRAFDTARWQQSQTLPQLFRTMGDHSVYHSKGCNFFFLRGAAGTPPYAVFFEPVQSNRDDTDAAVIVRSAYEKDGMTRWASPIKFPRLIDSVARGIQTPLGPPAQIRRR